MSVWSDVTPGERFSIRVSSEDSDGSNTMLEVFAEVGPPLFDGIYTACNPRSTTANLLKS
jgi:hypothetical protein